MKKPVLLLIALLVLVVVFVAALHHGASRLGTSRLSTAADRSEPGSAGVVKIGTNRALGTVTPYVALEKGLFQQQGIRVQIVDFDDVT
ncbi:MAG: hypothetical protein ABSD53_25365, partial [Terriglobales bacterium]